MKANRNLENMPQPFVFPSTPQPTTNETVCQNIRLKDYLLEDGLALRYCSTRKLETFSFSHLFGNKPQDDNLFLICCAERETADYLSVRCPQSVSGSLMRFLFNVDDAIVPLNDKKEVVVFTIDSKWIKKNYPDYRITFTGYMNGLPAVCDMTETPDFTKFNLLQHLNAVRNRLHKGKIANLLKLRIQVLLLIDQFFRSAGFIHPEELTAKRDPYKNEMEELGKRLSVFLKTNLPDLLSFAREYNMSLSSLKRHFKYIHGKPIYEFYLEQKMQLARNLIESSAYSIAQVAYELGYEDPKSLSRSFKKVYGFSPAKLRA